MEASYRGKPFSDLEDKNKETDCYKDQGYYRYCPFHTGTPYFIYSKGNGDKSESDHCQKAHIPVGKDRRERQRPPVCVLVKIVGPDCISTDYTGQETVEKGPHKVEREEPEGGQVTELLSKWCKQDLPPDG